MARPRLPSIDIIGDSHTVFFGAKKVAAATARMWLSGAPFHTRVHLLQGASLTGVRAYSSSLQIREKIDAVVKTADRLVLALGQVDLELGFYYKQVIKKETWTPDGYVAYLTDIYRTFLETSDFGPCTLALKGVNLTVLSTPHFARAYVGRIITEGKPDDIGQAQAALDAAMLNERDQNDLHLSFNANVALLAKQFGLGYFDLTSRLSARDDGGSPVMPAVLDRAHQPMKADHHLLSSIAVYRHHYEALQQTFGFSPGPDRHSPAMSDPHPTPSSHETSPHPQPAL